MLNDVSEWHDKCYGSYISESNVKAAKKKESGKSKSIICEPSRTRKRVSFDYSELCIVCGEQVGEKYLSEMQKKGWISLGSVLFLEKHMKIFSQDNVQRIFVMDQKKKSLICVE